MTAFTIFKPSLLSAAMACLLISSVEASTCITAGRMDAAGWAPQFQSVRLLDETGRILLVKNKSELTLVRAVELTEVALFVELQRKVSHYLQPILSHRFLNNLA